MKKLIYLFLTLFAFTFIGVVSVKAEEVPTEEETPTENETDPAEETPTETETEDNETTFEEFKALVEEKLSAYATKDQITQIIEWLVDSGVLVAMFGVFLKYQKFKHTTIEDIITEVKAEVGTNLQSKFDELSAEQIEKLVKSIDELKEAEEVVMKVLVLMQDTTANGKVALLEYLGSKTSNKEVKEQVTELQDKIEEQIETDKETAELVDGDYKKIF